MTHKFDPSKAANLDDPERRALMPPEVVLALAPAKPGAVIADVGCGTGYWTFAYLEAAPNDVKIYAIDTQEGMLEALKERLEKQEGRDRVVLVKSEESVIPLPDASVTIAILGHVYHELLDRRAFLREIWRIIEPGGRLVIVDWEVLAPEEVPLRGPPIAERVQSNLAVEEVRQAGFIDVQLSRAYRQQWIIFATR